MRRAEELFALVAICFLAQQPAMAAQPSGNWLSRLGLAECPGWCECSTWLGLPLATCTGHNLYSISTGAPSVVQALDLSNNSISKLGDRELSRVGMTRLKFLNLSINAISEIGLRAFDNLKNLTVLDLSYNRIDYIVPDTFYYNTNLRILNLAGNKFNLHVPKIHTTSLTELNMSGCRINYLEPDTFQGLKQLRKLDLSNNLLMELDKDVLRAMPYLKNLSLGRNIWSCDGATYDLELYLRTRNIRVEPLCGKSPGELPPSLATKFEKIIALKTINSEPPKLPPRKLIPEPTRSVNGLNADKDPWAMDSWRELEEAVQEQEQHSADSTASSGILANALSNVSPFWFLLIGFLLGSGATMVVTYLWLSTTISCLIPRIRRAEAADSADASSQRVSLLRHLWQQESMASTEDSSHTGHSPGNVNPGTATATTTTTTTTLLPTTTPSCPGTPPPPYREVMLHRNLYPRAAMAAAAAQAQAGRSTGAQAAANDVPTAPAYSII